MKKYPIIFFSTCFCILLIIAFSCNRNEVSEDEINNISQIEDPVEFLFPYDFRKPSVTYSLSPEMNKMSGMCSYRNNKIAMTVEDAATIFIYNLNKTIISGKYNFASNADYTGIDIVGEKAYTVRSDGKLYEINNFKDDNKTVEKYSTNLSARNNIDGLVYDSESNSLLLASKGKAAIDKFTNKIKEDKLKDSRAVFKFDLNRKELQINPVYLLNIPEITSFMNKKDLENDSISANNIDEVRKSVDIQPTGIAINPTTKNIYIISYTARVLLIMNKKGNILLHKKLNKKLFEKPTGICFNDNGDLFISVKPKGANSYILRFNLKKSKKAINIISC